MLKNFHVVLHFTADSDEVEITQDYRERFESKLQRVPAPKDVLDSTQGLDMGMSAHCAIWTGCIDSSGYGSLKFRGRPIGAHVFGYWAAIAACIPIAGAFPGLQVAHRCGVRACCESTHLYLASRSVNLKGREFQVRPGAVGITDENEQIEGESEGLVEA